MARVEFIRCQRNRDARQRKIQKSPPARTSKYIVSSVWTWYFWSSDCGTRLKSTDVLLIEIFIHHNAGRKRDILLSVHDISKYTSTHEYTAFVNTTGYCSNKPYVFFLYLCYEYWTYLLPDWPISMLILLHKLYNHNSICWFKNNFETWLEIRT